MAYVSPDYKTKKAFKAAVLGGERLRPYNPIGSSRRGLFEVEPNGDVVVEGPHYPKPHTWYADCVLENGVIVKVK